MSPVDLLWFVMFCHLAVIFSAGHGNDDQYNCPRSFSCGSLGTFNYPFTKAEQPHCGLIPIHGCCDGDDHSPKRIQLGKNGKTKLLTVVVTDEVDHNQNTIVLSDEDFHRRLLHNTCDALNQNYTLPSPSPMVSFYVKYNVTLFQCKHGHIKKLPEHYFKHECRDRDYDFYYESHPSLNKEAHTHSIFSSCSVLHFPSKDLADTKDIPSFVSGSMVVEVMLSADCDECCNHRGGHCRLDRNEKFYCDNESKTERKLLKLLLGLGLGIGLTIGILIIGCLILRRNRSRNTVGDVIDHDHVHPDPNPDPENGSVYFRLPLFSYKELQEATNNFHHANQLGSGGFGKVYYGKLRDGREVAVKRLYEHNYGRVEQFRNEIKILTRTRHTNLVSLYGCSTSGDSHELLLVYEYVQNGTVACHLHGGLARTTLLPWHIRMKIAVETASSLAYLHASDIIHRDVKTKNILLTNSFGVKVADFGLSRLFPHDVTHASTAPQGTPGYVDPDYHQCYQLTTKSDVYSFGVVLIELISSMPAVDMSRRHKDDINLSNLALKKIQRGAFSELVDPSLGFDSDNEVKRMVVSVKELAFQCLQRDKELRPSMDEVLKVLMRIESGKDENVVAEEDVRPPSPPSPDGDENIGLFKKSMLLSPPSPKAVVDTWDSESTTPNASGN